MKERDVTVYVDMSICQRPLCSNKGKAPATNELVFGTQILPICSECAVYAIADGFVAVAGTNAIVMPLLEHPEDDE